SVSLFGSVTYLSYTDITSQFGCTVRGRCGNNRTDSGAVRQNLAGFALGALLKIYELGTWLNRCEQRLDPRVWVAPAPVARNMAHGDREQAMSLRLVRNPFGG